MIVVRPGEGGVDAHAPGEVQRGEEASRPERDGAPHVLQRIPARGILELVGRDLVQPRELLDGHRHGVGVAGVGHRSDPRAGSEPFLHRRIVPAGAATALDVNPVGGHAAHVEDLRVVQRRREGGRPSEAGTPDPGNVQRRLEPLVADLADVGNPRLEESRGGRGWHGQERVAGRRVVVHQIQPDATIEEAELGAEFPLQGALGLQVRVPGVAGSHDGEIVHGDPGQPRLGGVERAGLQPCRTERRPHPELVPSLKRPEVMVRYDPGGTTLGVHLEGEVLTESRVAVHAQTGVQEETIPQPDFLLRVHAGVDHFLEPLVGREKL